MQLHRFDQKSALVFSDYIRQIPSRNLHARCVTTRHEVSAYSTKEILGQIQQKTVKNLLAMEHPFSVFSPTWKIRVALPISLSADWAKENQNGAAQERRIAKRAILRVCRHHCSVRFGQILATEKLQEGRNKVAKLWSQKFATFSAISSSFGRCLAFVFSECLVLYYRPRGSVSFEKKGVFLYFSTFKQSHRPTRV